MLFQSTFCDYSHARTQCVHCRSFGNVELCGKRWSSPVIPVPRSHHASIGRHGTPIVSERTNVRTTQTFLKTESASCLHSAFITSWTQMQIVHNRTFTYNSLTNIWFLGFQRCWAILDVFISLFLSFLLYCFHQKWVIRPYAEWPKNNF